jgi:hypothetical protein
MMAEASLPCVGPNDGVLPQTRQADAARVKRRPVMRFAKIFSGLRNKNGQTTNLEATCH